MALNFPNSPTDGQLYTDSASGNRWVWDNANTVWKSTSTFTQTITVSSTQPGSPVVGQLWWSQDYGRLFVYYNDGNSSQWVEANPADQTAGLVFNTANAAYGRANTALQNTSSTFAGDLTISGSESISKTLSINNVANTGAPLGITGNTTYAWNSSSIYSYDSGPGGVTYALGTRRGTFSISDETSGAQRVVIDSSGRMSRPYQPFARIGHTNQTNISFSNGVGVTVPFNSVIEQIGSNYNTTNYRYTAPVAGTYLITAAVQCGGINTSWYNLFLRVNGSNRFGTYTTGLNVGYQPLYTYGITNVNAGDYFDAYIIPNASAGTLELSSPDSRNMFCIYYLG